MSKELQVVFYTFLSQSDISTIEFVPKEKATNPFTWQKESADVWKVRLAGKDAQGKPTETIYRMERVKP